MNFSNPFKRKEPLTIKTPKKALKIRNAFEAASVNRFTKSWYHMLLSANREIQYDVLKLRGISRHLSNNDVYTSRYLDLIQTHIVGPSGIALDPRIASTKNKLNDRVNQELKTRWKEWGKVASLDGRLTFIDLEQLAIRTVAVDGEIFFRFVKGPKLNEFGFALMPIDADLLNIQFTDRLLGNGNIIIQGIEQTIQGVPVAYHFYNRDPYDVSTAMGLEIIRVPAEEVIHIYKTRRTNQVRGIPFITPAMYFLAKLHEYFDAELIAAQMAASTVATIESAIGDASQFLQPDGYAPEELHVEAGVALRLNPGEKMQTFNSQHPTTAFKAYAEIMLMGIASCLNISYNSLTSDPSKDNYSSGRLGAIEQRDYFRNMQMWFSRQFHEAVYKMWLECAIENNAINLPTDDPTDYYNVSWRARGWQWADPLKDSQGVQNLISLNMKSKTQLCAEQGLDYKEVLKDRFAEEQLERQMEKDLIDMGLPPTLSNVDTGTIKYTVAEKIEDTQADVTGSSNDAPNAETPEAESLEQNDDTTDINDVEGNNSQNSTT